MNLKIIIIISIVLTVLILSKMVGPKGIKNNQEFLQSQVAPGKLSAAHAQLATNCASCHTPVKGVDDAKCISCHADSKALLERQPTAFHVNIGNCSSCHKEHLGEDANLRVMNHEALARIAKKMISEGKNISNQLNNLDLSTDYPLVSKLEAGLNCASCHSTKDKHFGLLGKDCASCHATTQWTIPEFQHPSVNSINCAQCHQAPPSHYMEHFAMISQKIAGQGKAVVNQCYSCHKTTTFNDIKGVGFYKHH